MSSVEIRTVGRRGTGTLTRSSFCGLAAPEAAVRLANARAFGTARAQADARGSGLASVVRTTARNPCRCGLHSYKAATRESTSGMRNNEKFAEALRFFILGDMHVLSGCHTSEAWQRDGRAAGSTRVLARYPGSRLGDESICWPGRRRGFAWPDAPRAVTRTCRDVSLSGCLDQVASSPARGTDRRPSIAQHFCTTGLHCCGLCFDGGGNP